MLYVKLFLVSYSFEPEKSSSRNGRRKCSVVLIKYVSFDRLCSVHRFSIKFISSCRHFFFVLFLRLYIFFSNFKCVLFVWWKNYNIYMNAPSPIIKFNCNLSVFLWNEVFVFSEKKVIRIMIMMTFFFFFFKYCPYDEAVSLGNIKKLTNKNNRSFVL